MTDWIGVSLKLVITLEYKDANLAFQLGAIEGKELNLRASLCKILISSFAQKMDFAHNFSVDFF